MRIVIDCRMLYGQKSGIGYYLDHLIQALARIDDRNRYTLFYVSGTADRSRMVFLNAPNFETKALRFPNARFVRLFRDSSWPYRLMRKINWGWDVTHEPGFEPLPLAPRSVLTLHDLIFFRLPDQRMPAAAGFYQRRQREAARNAAAIIADSEHTRRDAIELLGVPEEKVHVIPLGVDPVSLTTGMTAEEASRKLHALGVSQPFVLSIGDIYKRKNNVTLVKAFGRLPADLRRTHQLVIAGAPIDPDVSGELRREIVASGLEGSVLLPGYVDAGARQALMMQAALLAYPSTYEGFGLPPLEAMACGVPTISARNTSIPEVVGDGGLLIEDYCEPAAWAEAIQRMLTDDDLRQACIEKGRRRVKMFTWEQTARETLKVYEQAASS